MSKGSSVHVFALRRRILEGMLTAEELEKDGVEVGDYLLTHMDTFGSNTVQPALLISHAGSTRNRCEEKFTIFLVHYGILLCTAASL